MNFDRQWRTCKLNSVIIAYKLWPLQNNSFRPICSQIKQINVTDISYTFLSLKLKKANHSYHKKYHNHVQFYRDPWWDCFKQLKPILPTLATN